MAALTIDRPGYVHILELLLILAVRALEICTGRLLMDTLSIKSKMFIWSHLRRVRDCLQVLLVDAVQRKI
jgi:hypothetical protein